MEFLQGHMDVKQYKMMFNIVSHQKKRIKTSMKYHYTYPTLLKLKSQIAVNITDDAK